MTDAQIAKTLTVKCNALKRIGKDLAYAKKEVEQEKTRLEKMCNAEEKDDYKIRQQETVIKESEEMVPDAIRRMKAACTDLQTFLDSHGSDFQEDVSEKVEEAKKLIAEQSS
eukprot:TRINITY_DN9034_c1_g1_i1.p1 TRINITY_DN9034_c1_g1~~TRINITY_DN9034_c1_g1_i1.p1  ORF type:complete len:131 (+),score=51.38 TRINITY_DN9034_c1_g1_i1:59-394(+)